MESLLEHLYLSGDLSLEEFIEILYKYNIFNQMFIAIKIYYSKKVNYL